MSTEKTTITNSLTFCEKNWNEGPTCTNLFGPQQNGPALQNPAHTMKQGNDRSQQGVKRSRIAFGGEEKITVKMSGTVKKVTDVAFKAGKNIDWEGMAKLLVSDEARREFANLRRAFDDVNSQLETKFSQEPEPIDWDYYRKGIGTRLVDMYKEHYESIEVPKFVDTVTPQYKAKFDTLLVELKEAEEQSLKESERLEKEIAEVQELKKKLSTMTADEYFAKHPELKKKFDDEIRNDNWGY